MVMVGLGRCVSQIDSSVLCSAVMAVCESRVESARGLATR